MLECGITPPLRPFYALSDKMAAPSSSSSVVPFVFHDAKKWESAPKLLLSPKFGNVKDIATAMTKWDDLLQPRFLQQYLRTAADVSDGSISADTFVKEVSHALDVDVHPSRSDYLTDTLRKRSFLSSSLSLFVRNPCLVKRVFSD